MTNASSSESPHGAQRPRAHPPRPAPIRIAMWSGPRNISTAMMRAWENRGDCAVSDEPLYAHYLAATGADHPGRDEVIASGETDWRRVVADLLGPVPDDQPVWYQKHMTHHLLPGMDRDWIGGIIVIDFIDVYDDKNKKKVYDELKKEFKRDRAKVTILPMSEFGLVQITRQRVRENVVRSITEQCPLCGGSGIIESSGNILTRIERWVKRYKLDKHRPSGKLLLKVHPMVYKTMREGTISNITKLAFKHLLRITLEEDSSLAFQDFRFIQAKTGEDITPNYT